MESSYLPGVFSVSRCCQQPNEVYNWCRQEYDQTCSHELIANATVCWFFSVNPFARPPSYTVLDLGLCLTWRSDAQPRMLNSIGENPVLLTKYPWGMQVAATRIDIRLLSLASGRHLGAQVRPLWTQTHYAWSRHFLQCGALPAGKTSTHETTPWYFGFKYSWAWGWQRETKIISTK